ncbi:MAG: hypothetical protein P1U78_08145 [Alcanivoracaceae bacterium]|nr:hypothetical protein [Alcanivoracaceae bacterium]
MMILRLGLCREYAAAMCYRLSLTEVNVGWFWLMHSATQSGSHPVRESPWQRLFFRRMD